MGNSSYNFIRKFSFLTIAVIFLMLIFITLSIFIYLKYNKAEAATTLKGDILYYDSLGESGIEVAKNSVIISRQSEIPYGRVGEVWKIPSYNPGKKLSWQEITKKMEENINRLTKERISGRYPYTSGGNVNISALVSDGNINHNNNPDGQGWKVNGNLIINQDFAVKGKGTFIVTGDLNIDNNISYQDNNSSIGFVVYKDVIIDKGIQNLRGFYYVPNGEIKFK